MIYRHFKRWIAVFLVLALCVPYLTGIVSAEDDPISTTEPEAVVTAENDTEDALAQLGEKTAPAEPEAAPEEPEAEPEEPLAEPEDPAEPEEPETEPAAEPEAEPAPADEPAGDPAEPAPEEPKTLADNAALADGRANAGEETLSTGGKTYILIGTKQQLHALDSYPSGDLSLDSSYPAVTGPIWRVRESQAVGGITWTPDYTTAELVYPGDADLKDGIVINNDGDTKDFSGYTLYGATNSGIQGPNAGADAGMKIGDTANQQNNFGGVDYRDHYVGGTLEAPNANVTSYSLGNYSPRGNYVVFRDINLNNEAWTPLMFYGVMIGVKGDDNALADSHLETKTLAAAVEAIVTSARSLDYTGTKSSEMALQRPTISNVKVDTNDADSDVCKTTTRYVNGSQLTYHLLDQEKCKGVGFFASITSNRPESGISFTPIQAQVRNLRLDYVRVDNNYDGIYVEETLVSVLTGTLAKVVGALLDRLLPLIIHGNTMTFTEFETTLNQLLDARQRDITNLATGGFVGRIDGDVLVENCEVNNVRLNSGYGYTGGFVGYATGCEQYLPVTGPVLQILETVLNLIPGLGLGDLIPIVSQVLRVNDLIPMDYLNPSVLDCSVVDLKENVGPAKANLEKADWSYSIHDSVAGSFLSDTGEVRYNGGFVGCKIATIMVNCRIENSSYTVWAQKYGGGFAGCARDAVIPTLLSGLGIDLFESSNANLQSVQVRCNITDSNVTVKGETCLGGFNGAMANAYCVNNEVSCPGKTLIVEGTGDCVGGFAGIATLGWAMNLGNDDTPGSTDLLSTVKSLLKTLASGTDKGALLNLLGVGQSYILGLQFSFEKSGTNGSEVTVTGRDYVGGLVGRGDALVMTGTSRDMLSELSYFQHGDLHEWDAFPALEVDEDYVVSFEVMTGATLNSPATVAVPAAGQAHKPENYYITLPSAEYNPTAPAGYTFEGWVLNEYDHTDAMPSKVYQPGEQVAILRDTTFYALFSKLGDTAYELVIEAPESNREWGGEYVITYGTSGDGMRVLTGLNNGANYAGNANGATALSTSGVHVHEKYKNFLVGVTSNSNYAWTATKVTGSISDYYFQNNGTSTYLKMDRQGTGSNRRGVLQADSSGNYYYCQWELSIRTTLADDDPYKDIYGLLLATDTDLIHDWHLGFDTSTNTFSAATADSTNPTLHNIYLWKASRLPTTYTTVAVGQTVSSSAAQLASLDDTILGPYKHVNAKGLKLVDGRKYVGGLVGLADTASVGSLIGDTLSTGDFEKFDFSEIYAVGSLTEGLTVGSGDSDYYVGGGIGLAIGGDIHPRITAYTGSGSNQTPVYDSNGYGVKLDNLKAVTGLNCVGGFAGCVGPGSVAGTGGLNVQLLGVSLLSANNLLSVGADLATSIDTVTVTGISGGYTVEAKGSVAENGLASYCAGGFFGRSNSTKVNKAHAVDVKWVQANYEDGRAGGFLGISEVGGLASMDSAEGTEIKSLLNANNLLKTIGYLIPTYTEVDVRFVDPVTEHNNETDEDEIVSGFVKAACAGGFAADFQSGTVDNSAKAEGDWYAVYNIDHVQGYLYAGGFGGKLFSGALAEAGGGISILGNIGLNLGELGGIEQLANLVGAYVPKVIKAGVKSDRSTRTDHNTGFSGTYDPTLAPSCQQGGFLVLVEGASDNKTTGAAGGFVGYASGAQISYCNVTQLRHTVVTPPTALEGQDGDSYFDNNSAYAVTGTRYAGGYAGFIDIGSSASLGGGLKLLSGNLLSANNVLGALNVVISTVEHSDVYGGPGGFAVLATMDNSQDVPEPEEPGAGGSKGLNRDGDETFTVFLVDETNQSSIYAWAWGSAGNKYSSWPGQTLTPAGSAVSNSGTGFNYYTVELNPELHDKILFNFGQDQWKSDDLNAVSDANGANHVVYYLFNDNGNLTISCAHGDDLWLTREDRSGCRGNYFRFNGLYGTQQDTEVNPNQSASHQFGPWIPYTDEITPLSHYRACSECGFIQKASCSYDEHDLCVCGRLKSDHEHSFGAWTKVEGENRHSRTCAVCGEVEYEACTLNGEYCSVCGGRNSDYPPLCENNTHDYSRWLPVEGENKHYRTCVKCGHYEEQDCDFDTDDNGVDDVEYCTVCGRRDARLPGSIAESSGLVGRAGGFVGWLRGSHIQDSSSYNFSYVVGQIAAGGYAGEIEPGSVADAIGDTSVLGGLASVEGSLLQIADDFVPTIRNSETTCIPCGGAVRANAASDDETQRGMAGGYVGHNCGGQIWGNNDDPWREEYAKDNNGDPTNNYAYSGPTKECRAVRILSVYGYEYAGGFTGLMDPGSTASTGNVSLLFDLVKLNGLLDALQISYPSEENTAVYGPLYGVTPTQWNSWLEYVGQYGGYGLGMKPLSALTLEDNGTTITYASMTDAQKKTAYEDMLAQYLYGYHVAAGRDEFVNDLRAPAGCAGGYVGSMRSGTITNGQAHNAKQVTAMRNAGGFAGDMKTGSVANLRQVSLGTGNELTLNLSQLLTGALQIFVPVVKTSSVHGYQSGLTVFAFGDPDDGSGCAGGFAGSAFGAQIWGDADDSDNPGDGCNVYNLKKVMGSRYAGGYLGILGSGAAAEVGTNVSEGPLQDLLDSVVQAGGDSATNLLSVAGATVSTVRYAEITVADPEWGFTVGGWSETVENNGESETVKHVPLAAGGFVGDMEGAIIGNRGKTVTVTPGQNGADDSYTVNEPTQIPETNIVVNGLRGVEAQYFAGGFFGNANMGGAASTSKSTNVLSLLNLGQVNALDLFRPYIYNSTVNGVDEGFVVRTDGEEEFGVMATTHYTGCAGGFGGGLYDGTVKNASVNKLSSVKALNYAGGFVGHTGKGGLANVDKAQLAQLLQLNASAGAAFGSYFKKASVSGIRYGYTVEATGGTEPIAGGFIGFADLAKVGVKTALDGDDEREASLACSASNLKLVVSDQIAGGFVGRTTKGYLVELQAGSPVVNLLLQVINIAVKALYLDGLERANLLNLGVAGIAGLGLFDDGDAIRIELGELVISVRLGNGEGPDGTDVAKITIGDSYIELPCQEGVGLLGMDDGDSNANIRLFPLFYTTIKNSTVTGFGDKEGFDVFAGGADQEHDGTDPNGYAGGFVGCNQLGEISGCQVIKCDVVRGTPADTGDAVQKVGPFTGYYTGDSGYSANEQDSKETDDTYLDQGNEMDHSSEDAADVTTAPFESSAKLVLMKDMEATPNPDSVVPETADMQNPCVPTVDLTISKVWEDLNGTMGARADADVTVTLTISKTSWTKDQNGNFVKGTTTDISPNIDLTKEDASEWSANVWTRKLTGLRAYENGVWYTYAVKEATVSTGGTEVDMSAYITGTAYADSQAAPTVAFSGAKDSGYVAKINNTTVLNQEIVVDFGLPVEISVVDYLKAKMALADERVAVIGVLAVDDLSNVSRYSTVYTEEETEKNAVSESLAIVKDETTGKPTTATPVAGDRARYGSFDLPTVEGNAVNTKLRYVPGTMQFDRPVEIVAAMQKTDGSNYYTKVKVIPANNIYFEENFIDFYDASFTLNGTTYESKWLNAGEAEDSAQAEDRPGIDDLDLDNLYGYDESYTNGATYSLGNAKYIRVYPGTQPRAEFTFTGTGFDLLAITDKNTGYMRVEVYRVTDEGDTQVASWGIDTFYGYTRTLETDKWIRYYCVLGGDELWHVAKSEASSKGSVTETVNGVAVTVLEEFPASNDLTNYTSFIVYRPMYTWTVDTSTTDGKPNAIYNVPVITSRGQDVLGTDGTYGPMSYDTYKVVIKPLYYPYFDHDQSTLYYDLYIDGVRIYGPAEKDLDGETDINNLYLRDHEGWPQFMELRKLLTTQGEFGKDTVVFIDGFTIGQTNDFADFQQYGPNHEIYLAPDQAIGFTLQKGHAAEVDQIHISLKSVTVGASTDSPARLSFSSGITTSTDPETGNTIETVARSNTLTLNTVVECYYELSGVVEWTQVEGTETDETGLIVIRNTGDKLISLRNLKVTYTSDPGANNLVSVKTKPQEDLTQQAMSILRLVSTLPIIEDDDPIFAGASVSLESDLSLHFYIPAEFFEGKVNPYVLFTRNTEDGPELVSRYDYVEESMNGVPCRRYSFRNISAAQMGDQVVAQLFYNQDGVDHMGEPMAYSVKQYAMNMLAKTEDPALRTLLVDLLNYGAEAQSYYGVRTDAPVNAELTETQRSWATASEPALASHRELLYNSAAKVWFEGASLNLNERVAINYYLDIGDQSVTDLELRLCWQDGDTTKTVVLDGASFRTVQINGKTLYVATLDALNAAQMRTVVNAAVYRKTTQTAISDTMRYSIESYAYSKRADRNESLKTLILAMMKYGDATWAYFTQD